MLVSTEALASRHIVKYLIYSDDDTLRRDRGGISSEKSGSTLQILMETWQPATPIPGARPLPRAD